MENFSLFNLLRALGAANAGIDGDGGTDTGGGSRADGEILRAGSDTYAGTENNAGRTAGKGVTGGAPPPPRGGQANVLATILERHEKISNRIKNRPPNGR